MEHRLQILRRFKERLSMKAKPLVIGLTVALVFGIALVDPFIPLGLTLGILYAIPVALIGFWSSSTESKLVVMTAVACTALTLLNLLIAPPDIRQGDLPNRLLAVIAIWGIALVSLMRKQMAREVKALRGLLSICSYCKRVRDSNGNWTTLEHYVTKHSEAHFSHGICPECFPKYFPDTAVKKTEAASP